ncbi:acyltransferase family protein [Pararobbsia alpina]|nr:acyltransferase [Pararobbsia alpina]
MEQRRLDFIQALRGIAALGVVICHARWFLHDTPNWDSANRYLIWGAGGVDLFFIISGFIMVYATRNFDGSPSYVRNFGIKRFAKIWPPYAVATIIWLLVGRGSGYLSEYHTNLIKSLLFIPFDSSRPLYLGSEQTTLSVGWTLNYEAYFYVAFGLSMLFKKLRWVVFSGWMLFFLIALPSIYDVGTLDPLAQMGFRSSYLSMMTNPIIWNFLIGVILGHFYLTEKLPLPRPLAWSIALLALTICLWGYVGNFWAVDGIKGWGGYSAALVLGLAVLAKTENLRVPRVLVTLGNMSFTLYLTHEIAFNLVLRAYSAVGQREQVHTWAASVLAVGVSLSLAIAVSGLLENRLHDLALRVLSRRNRMPNVLTHQS